MDIFHVILDTSLLRQTPLGHPHWARLLTRVQQGVVRVYIPQIALEERRTQLVENYEQAAAELDAKARELRRGELARILEGLPQPALALPTKEEVDENSRRVFEDFLATHKVEVLPFTFEHAVNVWQRYFGKATPFDTGEARLNRRKHIPDAWILEAVLEIRGRLGRHCVLVRDGNLEKALEAAGFELWNDIEALDAEVEVATAVVPIHAELSTSTMPLDRLRSTEFDNVDRILLGLNEAWNSPAKETLFTKLEVLGIRRAIVEHEAKTLELSGALTDTGSHLIPTNRDTARRAANDPLVQELLLKALDHEL